MKSIIRISVWVVWLLVLICTVNGQTQSTGVAYDVDGGLCDVVEYSYATYVHCPDLATNMPGVQNVSFFLEALPNGTLNANSNITFCTHITSSVYCDTPYPLEYLTGTLIKGKSPTGAATLQLQASMSGPTLTGSSTFTITTHVTRYRINWTAAPGVLLSTGTGPITDTLVGGGSGGGGNCPCNPVPPIPSTSSAHCVGPCGSKP